jgi:hypothetical protein
VAVALIALAGAACDRRPAAPPSTPAAAEPAWVARVNGQPITEAEVQQEIQRRTAARRAVGDADSLVRELVERKAMLDEAARSPALQDPAVRRELENRQLGQWLDRTLKVERDRVTVTDDELRAHFAAHPETARQPEMVRLAILYRKANPRDPAESSTALRDELAAGPHRPTWPIPPRPRSRDAWPASAPSPRAPPRTPSAATAAATWAG